jgi:hypothetical protein
MQAAGLLLHVHAAVVPVATHGASAGHADGVPYARQPLAAVPQIATPPEMQVLSPAAGQVLLHVAEQVAAPGLPLHESEDEQFVLLDTYRQPLVRSAVQVETSVAPVQTGPATVQTVEAQTQEAPASLV